MPTVKANGLTFHYDQQRAGAPLVLIPYLTADHACYAFQVAEYAKHFTCISIDLRGCGESDDPETSYTTRTLADDVAGVMQAIGVAKAHISGLSLGAAVGMWLAAKFPDRVASLSLHSAWHETDPFGRAVVQSWQVTAQASPDIATFVVGTLFPWCFTPELYASRPEYIQALAEFVRSRPTQSLASFMRQPDAAITHNAKAQLPKITAPTLITFGRYDVVTSTRFAEPLQKNIPNSETYIFEGSSHAPIYEQVEEFNDVSLRFLKRQANQAAVARP